MARMKTKLGILLLTYLFAVSFIYGDSLQGNIADEASGLPVSGAVVWLENTGFSDTTDVNGNYSITGIPIGAYTIIIEATDYQQRVYTDFIVNDSLYTDIRSDFNKTIEFQLLQNYPNPFNPSTTITYRLEKDQHVILRIFDLLGRNIYTLVDNWRNSGTHKVVWQGEDNKGEQLPSGVYYYQLVAGKTLETRKMLLVK